MPIAASAAIAICPATAQSPRSVTAPPPPGTALQPARAAPDMQAVLDALASLGSKPIETLIPVDTRTQPSVADGAKAVMAKTGMSTAPDPTVTTRDMPYGSDPRQFARIYKPANVPAAGSPCLSSSTITAAAG